MPAIMTEQEPAQTRVRTDRLQVEVVSTDADFLQLESAWECLVKESNLDHPFLSFEWMRSWWESFGAGKSLHIVVVREGVRVLGIAPLMLTRRKFYGLSVRCLESIANVHTPRFDLLVADRPAEVHRAIWDHIR